MKVRLEGSLSRRQFVKAATLLTSAVAIGGTREALAQAKGQIVVGTWGGDYAKFLTKNVEQPLLIGKGWEVIQDQAGQPERRAKMLAERRLPHGTSDIQGLDDLSMYQMHQLGATEEIDYSKLANADTILPSMKRPYGVGQIFSGLVCFHNPDIVANAPSSYRELLDPANASKLGIVDLQYQYNLAAATIAAGGSTNDFDPGKELLLELRKAGARIYPSNEAIAQGLSAGEFGIGMLWKARVVQWQNAGIKVEATVPEDGMIPFVCGFAVPKNAPNKEGAYAYLNAMLESSAQAGFAIDMGYNPTVSDAEISNEVRERIGFTPDEASSMKELDYNYITENDAALKEWWDRVFKAA